MSLISYIKETRHELKHVSWPTRRQAIAFTIIVIVVSLVVSAYLGLLDYVFSKALELILR